MVTGEKIYNAALIRYGLGNLLIWLGLLKWLPFIALRIAREKPSLFLYLPFHTLGVIGGSRLRAFARRGMGATPPKKNFLQILGHGMILVGILVGAPYFYLKFAAHQPVDVMKFLPYHLTGVLGGLALLGIGYLTFRNRNVKA